MRKRAGFKAESFFAMANLVSVRRFAFDRDNSPRADSPRTLDEAEAYAFAGGKWQEL